MKYKRKSRRNEKILLIKMYGWLVNSNLNKFINIDNLMLSVDNKMLTQQKCSFYILHFWGVQEPTNTPCVLAHGS